jgi:hypothetical protein
MSAVTSSEVPTKSDVFRHVNQRMFAIGCGQSLAKRWLTVHVGAPANNYTSGRGDNVAQIGNNLPNGEIYRFLVNAVQP